MLLLFVRTTVLYFIIIGAMRLMGKRQISEMQPSELVTTILISNIVTLPIEDTDLPLIAGIIPTLLLICYEVFLSYFSLKSSGFRKVVTGSSVIIIGEGEIVQKNLKNLRITIDDLLEQLRLKDVFDIRDVYYAYIETNGELSILKKQSSTTKKQDTPPPVALICDGKPNKQALKDIKKSMQWLDGKLEQSHIDKDEIFLMLYDVTDDGSFFVLKELP